MCRASPKAIGGAGVTSRPCPASSIVTKRTMGLHRHPGRRFTVARSLTARTLNVTIRRIESVGMGCSRGNCTEPSARLKGASSCAHAAIPAIPGKKPT